MDILEVRLPRDEDIEFLGCTKNGYDCESAPEWIYSTSYWLETPYNNTSSYITNVSRRMGVDPNAQIDVNNPDVMTNLLAAMTVSENGREGDIEVIKRGVAMA